MIASRRRDNSKSFAGKTGTYDDMDNTLVERSIFQSTRSASQVAVLGQVRPCQDERAEFEIDRSHGRLLRLALPRRPD
jgi:hypothetical protein